MKKVISIMLALVMCFALAMPAFAADEEALPPINGGDVTTTAAAEKPEATLPDMGEVTVPDFGLNGDVMAAIQEVLAQLGDTEFGNLDEFNRAFRDALAGIVGEDTMNKITDIINSNEFLKWLASIYTYGSTIAPTEETTVTTTEAPASETEEETTVPMAEIVPTGDSAVALAVFATVSVAAAAAFVCTKKKA